jgi:hypothetical protein
MILPPPWPQYHHQLVPPPPQRKYCKTSASRPMKTPYSYQNMAVCAEADFLDAIGTKDLRVFLSLSLSLSSLCVAGTYSLPLPVRR